MRRIQRGNARKQGEAVQLIVRAAADGYFIIYARQGVDGRLRAPGNGRLGHGHGAPVIQGRVVSKMEI
jgi:hypothetical protein